MRLINEYFVDKYNNYILDEMEKKPEFKTFVLDMIKDDAITTENHDDNNDDDKEHHVITSFDNRQKSNDMEFFLNEDVFKRKNYITCQTDTEIFNYQIKNEELNEQCNNKKCPLNSQFNEDFRNNNDKLQNNYKNKDTKRGVFVNDKKEEIQLNAPIKIHEEKCKTFNFDGHSSLFVKCKMEDNIKKNYEDTNEEDKNDKFNECQCTSALIRDPINVEEDSNEICQEYTTGNVKFLCSTIKFYSWKILFYFT